MYKNRVHLVCIRYIWINEGLLAAWFPQSLLLLLFSLHTHIEYHYWYGLVWILVIGCNQNRVVVATAFAWECDAAAETRWKVYIRSYMYLSISLPTKTWISTFQTKQHAFLCGGVILHPPTTKKIYLKQEQIYFINSKHSFCSPHTDSPVCPRRDCVYINVGASIYRRATRANCRFMRNENVRMFSGSMKLETDGLWIHVYRLKYAKWLILFSVAGWSYRFRPFLVA